jgi:hypothetical protein
MRSDTRSPSLAREHTGKSGGLIATPTTTGDEQVHGKLPRKVRTISCRLDHHQVDSTAALNALQGEMAKLIHRLSEHGLKIY